jgi:ubiquinone/menaquinone biosynthesis C-methylase UbiE
VSRALVNEGDLFLLDLGGGPASFFAAHFPEPGRVVLVDQRRGAVLQARDRVPGLRLVVADGQRLPLADDSIGTTICNSVIEHVEDAAALAAEIRRVSRAYFVQTPNGRFPLELHAPVPIPLYRWIPWAAARRALCRLFGGNFAYIERVRYLSEAELTRLFPEAEIVRERFLGMTKSYYVIAMPAES